jgi:quercetin dioxygenase-like cupin family protein
MPDDTSRLRVPPRERFAGSEQVISLEHAFAELPRESVQRQGHMQKTLYRHGPTTTAIFAFDAGSGLKKHSVDGEAIVHVIEGRVKISTENSEYELGANQLILLNPGVTYDLEAIEPTRMLFNVVLKEEER